MSRPRFDKSAADRYLAAVRAGVSEDVAAMHAEIPVKTARDWMRGDRTSTRAFAAAVDKARADLQLLAIGQIRLKMSEGDRGAAAFVAQSVAADQELKRLRELTT
jgi:hypothetical protein